MTRKEAIRVAHQQTEYKLWIAHVVIRHRMPAWRGEGGGYAWRVYPIDCEAVSEIRPNDPDNLIILTTVPKEG